VILIENDCRACFHYNKVLNICLCPETFVNARASILHKNGEVPVPLQKCIDDNLFRKKHGGNKYKNIKVLYDGILFASIKEADRYAELKILLKQGLITDLKLQPRYNIGMKTKKRDRFYVADFEYYDTVKQKTIVEDTKGYVTDAYKLKKGRFLELYPEYEFFENH